MGPVDGSEPEALFPKVRLSKLAGGSREEEDAFKAMS